MTAPLTPGSRLGAFEILDRLGAGGMGEVWRARDAALDRDVALKFLPPGLASDADRLARFEREAKVLASLNHPNIAAIYGLHEHDGTRFLAMELVPGEDLAQRLERGRPSLEEALPIARQIAEALETAHDQGIVHRDLKPANVKLTPDGKIKVLDFGLAKALDPVASTSSGGAVPTMSPTITSLGTVAGVILGTAAYMSPEQAKGKPVDRRTDIWAFGCILYEMLAGKRPFEGEGVSEVLAAVIMAPIAFDALPEAIPTRLRRLVQRCLERDPRRRLRDIGEARIAIEEILAGSPDEAAPASVAAAAPPLRRAIAIAVVATALLVGLAAAGLANFLSAPPAEPPVRRFEIAAQGPFTSSELAPLVAISPDGKTIAYAEGGKLLLRPLARTEPVAVTTATPLEVIFWSPDSAFIGYEAAGKLWKAPAAGGDAKLVADVRAPMTGGAGATWCPDGTIVLSTGEGDLRRVSDGGGDLETIVPLDAKTETDFHDPACLPDGSLLFVPHAVGGRPNVLVLYSGGKRKELFKLEPDQDIWYPAYDPAGYILFQRHPANAGVWALPFSLKHHDVTGEPFLVAAGADVPSVSSDGTLVHVRASASRLTQLVWADRTGKELGPVGPPQEQWPFPAISPDGRSVAIAAKDHDLLDIWILDAARGTKTRLQTPGVAYSTESWASDGRTIVYAEGTASFTLKSKAADGSGDARTVHTGWGPSYSRDGRYLFFADGTTADWDTWYLDTRGDGKPVPLAGGPGQQVWPRLSPDGTYVAYVSDESGPPEVYLKRFPSGEGKWQVSSGGGMWPHWNGRGDRLTYARGDAVMEVEVAPGDQPRLGAPKELFVRKPLGWTLVLGWFPGFDVSPDGERFLFARPIEEDRNPGGIVVVERWLGEFKKRER